MRQKAMVNKVQRLSCLSVQAQIVYTEIASKIVDCSRIIVALWIFQGQGLQIMRIMMLKTSIPNRMKGVADRSQKQMRMRARMVLKVAQQTGYFLCINIGSIFKEGKKPLKTTTATNKMTMRPASRARKKLRSVLSK